jgi:hypothetical protein
MKATMALNISINCDEYEDLSELDPSVSGLSDEMIINLIMEYFFDKNQDLLVDEIFSNHTETSVKIRG